MFAVDVRLLDSSWGRLMALSLENRARRLRPRGGGARGAGGGHRPARPAARRAAARALARRVPVRAGRRARARRPTRAGARRRSASRRRPRRAAARGRGVARARLRARAARRRARRARRDGITWTRLAGDLRSALSSTGLAVLLGPRDVDLLILLALGARGYDAALAEHVAHLFHGALDRHGLGPGGRGAGDRRRPPTTWAAAGQGAAPRPPLGGRGHVTAGRPLARRPPPRRRRPAARPARHARSSTRSSRSSSARCWPTAPPRTRVLLETLEAYLAAGGRKAEAARALHLERQSLYLRLHRIEELLGVSLDDEDVVLGLHLAVGGIPRGRCAAAPRVDGPSGHRAAERDVPPIAGRPGPGRAWRA